MTGPDANAVKTMTIFCKWQNTEMTKGIRVFKTFRKKLPWYVPFNVHVNQPNGLGETNGAQVNHKPLKNNIEHMLNQQVAYKSNVAVIWDSKIQCCRAADMKCWRKR